MKDFISYNPTKVEFGRDKENFIGSYMMPYEVKKVLIVYGSKRIKDTGLFDRATKSLTENGIEFIELSGIKSNPVISKAREGIHFAKENNIDAILAIGGGSVIDTAKVIAAGALYDGDPWDLCTYKKSPESALKLFVILTQSAAGSETNSTAVIGNEETKEKLGFNSLASFPVVSVINPELQSTVTSNYLAYSAVDIASHCLDLYFTATYLPDFTADHIETIVKTVIRTTDLLLEDPEDYNARSEFIWAASLALDGSTRAGVEGNRFDTHLIEHSLSALYDVPHGAGLAVVLPSWMNWQMPMNPERYKRFARNVFGCSTAREGIEAFKNWIISIGAPVTLEEIGISKKDVHKIAVHIFQIIELSGMQSLLPIETLEELLNQM
uniref:iron-containing alcohol dehydrogenase n=1 Tax=Clostridium sp. 12(A) TaxID=1163671 RepID=UPI0004634E9E|nr:iron-containing alcohol dehydrogenase [Clostridium sp. 12(A)]